MFRLRELSLQEAGSSDAIVRFLRRHGFRVRRGVAGLPTAFTARRRGRRRGPRIALLAEYDALPEIGHACGHNLIGAAACGAAAVVSSLLECGEIVVYGTPAEETIGGKVVMARRGAFRGVDAALMFHPATENRVYMTSLACHSLEVVYRGRAAHAVASPEKGINALHALLALFADMERLKRRLPKEVRMPGIVSEGGRRANIVPDRAAGRFTLRARDGKVLGRVERAFREAARRAARDVGARVRIRAIDEPYDEMITNRALADAFKEELRALGRRTVDTPRKSMGSLDMGNVSHRVPAIHPFVAIAPRSAPLHSRAFARQAGGRRGREGLLVATQALATVALRLLDPRDDLLSRARREFRRGRPGPAVGRRLRSRSA
ncbi:MAG TPA: amidohydrolase [Candidatus Cryosericum sp.]|nr:amidohydrolase [Candidatus Cryosericum sp.]